MSINTVLVGGNHKLDKIVADKIKELEEAKMNLPFQLLKQKIYDSKPVVVRDFSGALKKTKGMALIAEIKKASPSLGDIGVSVDILDLARIYEQNGADAISVLTDAHFNGRLEYIKQVKSVTKLPILRKDFIFEPYQVYESKHYGADALLLIASIVTRDCLFELVNLTHQLGMECLLEVHSDEDLAKALSVSAEVVGINARNLQTFEISLDNIIRLAKNVPLDRLVVAESGIQNADDVFKVRQAGARAMLVGTALMQADDLPAKIRELKQ